MSTGLSEEKTLYLLTEQFSNLRAELSHGRDSYADLLEKVSAQSVLLASLAERIDANNRLLDERKRTDHERIKDLQEDCVNLTSRIEDLERFRWNAVGVIAAVVVFWEVIKDKIF